MPTSEISTNSRSIHVTKDVKSVIRSLQEKESYSSVVVNNSAVEISPIVKPLILKALHSQAELLKGEKIKKDQTPSATVKAKAKPNFGKNTPLF